MNWEAIYLNVTVGGALVVALVCVLVLAYYAYRAMWPERRDDHPDPTGAAIRAAMEADGSLERDRRAVSGEEPYEVLYTAEVVDGEPVFHAHYALSVLEDAYAEKEMRES